MLSFDGECEPDILAMIAASAALTISGVPFMGPIGAVRVGYEDGEYTLNPKQDVAAADVVEVDGWFLSATEARLAGLASTA